MTAISSNKIYHMVHPTLRPREQLAAPRNQEASCSAQNGPAISLRVVPMSGEHRSRENAVLAILEPLTNIVAQVEFSLAAEGAARQTKADCT